MADVAFLIPSRNEEFLSKTIESILANIRGDSEIIAVLDGAWADPPVADHPRVTLIHRPIPIGQRAATNLAARMTSAKYVCKIDAHCSIDEGFDIKMMQASQEVGPDVSLIPAMNNLHAFNHRCKGCGTETYQGPTPTMCAVCAAKGTQGGPFERVMYWDLNAGGVPGKPRRTEFWRFDHDLHFQYGGPRLPEQRNAEIADVMSSVGACFFVRRDRFWELGGLDTGHGSWGQLGTEWSCKNWLSGGKQMVVRRTFFAHLFRTQGGDFGFPYAMRSSDQEKARQHSRKLWLYNTWPGQVRPLSWLIDHFKPAKDWHDTIGQERLALVKAEGEKFYARRAARVATVSQGRDVDLVSVVQGHAEQTIDAPRQHQPALGLSRGIVYYSDCRGDERILQAVRQQIRRAAGDLPIVSVTLKPIDFGKNIALPLLRSYETMFEQILVGLKALDTDLVYFAEHDVLYSPESFQFTPPTRDRFYYNENRWQVSADDGRAVHYRCCQTAQLCADRLLLIEHYKRRIAAVQAAGGYQRNMGFEPGTNKWARSIHDVGFKKWFSKTPNLDIRHGRNLSKTRWRVEDFRNKSTCQGWTESPDGTVPGWGLIRGRFHDFLADLGRTASATEGAA